MIKTTLALVAAAALATSAQAITVINGSFELGAPITGGNDLLLPGDTTSITGWRVLPTGVDYVDSSLWDAQNGDRSVELNGVGVGGVSQILGPQFTPGLQYRISFWLSANPFAADGDYTAVVSASGGGARRFVYTKTSDNSPTNMLYQRYFYVWTPGAANSAIAFRGLEPGPLGVVLDNVSVSVIPEPATWGLLLAGFGMTGFAMRRRRTAVVSA